jgi:predicted AlkP superfamily pyrophosphatase or phosphodiesterase
VWLGVPVIYSTYMQYDELAHHFGPSSTGALSDLKRTDARIAEIWRMIQDGAPRRYDLVILSDHGMTPARSYRVMFKESLGSTVTRLMSRGPDGDRLPRPGETGNADVLTSASEDSEYADVGPGIVESVAQMSRHRHKSWRRALRAVRDWTRSRYGLREIIFPEKYRVDARHELVVTYSSCLALIYFYDTSIQLTREEIREVPRRA